MSLTRSLSASRLLKFKIVLGGPGMVGPGGPGGPGGPPGGPGGRDLIGIRVEGGSNSSCSPS